MQRKADVVLPPAPTTPSNFFPLNIFSPPKHNMARGNQRDKAREKNLKKQGNVVCVSFHQPQISAVPLTDPYTLYRKTRTPRPEPNSPSLKKTPRLSCARSRRKVRLRDTLTRSHYFNRLPQPMKNEPPRQQRVGRNNTLILDTPFDIAIATSHYAKRETKDDIKEFWTPERHFIHALYRPSEAF